MHAVTLDQIRIDGGTQPRETIDQATVDEYAEAMERRTRFPPLVVYFDGENAWLADGFHRYYAALKAGVQSVDVDWREGTLEMAKLYAAGANAEHGLRRTPGDKRRAIEMVLSTKAGRRWTQEQIARHCHVAQSYVSVVANKYHSDNRPRNPPGGAEPTKAEKKRASIAEAVSTRPEVSARQIARKLGVDRETVGKARARSTTRAASASHEHAPSLASSEWSDVAPSAADRREPSASPARSRQYGGVATRDAARIILNTARIACADWDDADWELLREQWNEIGARRRSKRVPPDGANRHAITTAQTFRSAP
jgi:ParB-like chromosome segregation protein Spo0J